MNTRTLNYTANGVNYNLVLRTISWRESDEIGSKIKPMKMSRKQRKRMGKDIGHFGDDE